MKETSAPTISIGLPVYNGEDTLAAAIDSLLAQTFENFEIIICDNASTDGTQTIAEDYASRDERVRYYRADRNRGAAPNFQWAFELSRGRYFKWHGADDLIRPDFLDACLAPLEADPGVVLCYPIRECIRYGGEPLERDPFLVNYRQLPEDQLDDIGLTDFLRIFASRMPLLIHGLMRSSVLKKVGPFGAFHGSDLCLVYELRLHGRFAQVPQSLYIQRLHPMDAFTQSRMNRRGDAAWHGAKGRLVTEHPELNLLLELVRAQRRAARHRGAAPVATVRELLALRAHIEIRTVRSVWISWKNARRGFFGGWSDLSESFLSPDAPNLPALRVWRANAALARGDLGRALALLKTNDADQLIEEGLGRLLDRCSADSLSTFTDWLTSQDSHKAELAVRVYYRAAPQKQAGLLAYLEAEDHSDARVRLDSASSISREAVSAS